MKTYFLSLALFGCISIHAQQTETFFAVSASDASYQWLNIQRMRLNNEEPLQLIYDHTQSNIQFLNGYSRRPVVSVNNQSSPTETMVAAAAYASFTRRLYFIPMKKAELRWMEWNEKGNPVFLSVQSPVLSTLDLEKPENQITRMTIGIDGYGYALTNDGNHLFRFTTGSNPVITDLGNLIDATSNGQQTVHSQCSSWGGDLVAAADGNLYLITLRNHIYQISPSNRRATYKGVITDLPQNFTSNAAAATANGDLLVGCSTGNQNAYIVDMKTFRAKPAYSHQPANLNVSDMASAYFLMSRNGSAQDQQNQNLFTANTYKVSIFPNPVIDNRFRLNFQQTNTGMHSIQVMDLSGQIVYLSNVNISGRGQAHMVELPSDASKGMYLVRVTDQEEKTVYVSKVVLQ